MISIFAPSCLFDRVGYEVRNSESTLTRLDNTALAELVVVRLNVVAVELGLSPALASRFAIII